MKCHDAGRFENDWVNLKDPQFSRILRAPLAKGADGYGLGLCRDRKADTQRRIRLLWNGYAHSVQAIDKFAKEPIRQVSTEGAVVASFASSADAKYQSMLSAIVSGRKGAGPAAR